jgi:hypothetical protein
VSVHSFNTEIAEKYGLNAAIIFYHIVFWIEKNEANETNYHDGHYWTYNSVKAFKTLFPYMGDKQIRNALKKLEDEDLVICGNYNKSPYDRTRWYALTEKGISILPKGQMDFTKRANESSQKGETIPDTIPDVKPVNSLNTNVFKGDESKKGKCPSNSKRFVKPTIEEIRAYCSERNNTVDAESFYDFYESKGWVVGKSPMKDWKSAVRNWERSRKESGQVQRYTQRTSENPNVDSSWIHSTKL